MKIKFKDYEIELSVVELKELFFNPSKTSKFSLKDGSSKPTIELKELFKTSKETDKNPHNKKVTNEQIKQIKSLAEQGLGNPEIAKRLNLYPELINYWRKNTPKGLYD